MPCPACWNFWHNLSDLLHLILRQLTEDNYLVEAIKELRPEVLLQFLIHQRTDAVVLRLVGQENSKPETPPFSITLEPMMLEVMISMFLKSTVRP